MELDPSLAAIGEVRDTPGQWLFHYTTLETALVHILPTLRLRLSPFSEMRDPREYRFIVRSPHQYEYVDVAGCLQAVCRGPESARTADEALRFFAKKLGIGLGLVEWHNNDPKLIGKPLVSRSS